MLDTIQAYIAHAVQFMIFFLKSLFAYLPVWHCMSLKYTHVVSYRSGIPLGKVLKTTFYMVFYAYLSHIIRANQQKLFDRKT